jgi:muramoyltetrapeptide carboxypeptidase
MLSVEAMGFMPVLGRHALARDGYLAGTDALRAADINEMFADPAIDGIIALRGGYGAQRIIPLLDLNMIAGRPKFFAGYSDITALIALWGKLGFCAAHTPMPATQFYRLYKEPERSALTPAEKTALSVSAESFRKAAAGVPQGEFLLKSLSDGHAEGPLTGGNLSLIASSIRTPCEMDTRGRILFIEEIGEEPYKLDRLLWQLRQSGKLSECAGVIFGAFTDCGTAEEVIADACAGLGIPVVSGMPAGHTLPNISLMMGAAASIDNGSVFLS